MNNQQNNDFTMFKQVNAFFTLHAAKILGNVPLQLTANNIGSRISKVNDMLSKQESPTTGYTADKLNAKKHMVNAAWALGNAASVYFKLSNDLATAAKLRISKTALFKLGDNKCKAACQGMHKIMVDNISVLDPDYVTAAELGNLKELIKAFNADSDDQSDAKKETPVATKAIKEYFTLLYSDMDDADNLMAKYALTDPFFFAEYQETRKVPDYGLHHSGIDGVVTNAVTSAPLQGVKIVDDQAPDKHFALSDPDGNYNLDELTAVQHTFTATLAGYQPAKFGFTIRKGKHIHFNFTLTPL